MRRTIWLAGAVVAVLFMVGCGPPDEEELSQQAQASTTATPKLFGLSCPSANTCSPDYGKCTAWSQPAGCGDPSLGISVQTQTCFDAYGNKCTNVWLSSTTDR